jgi:hypothetical protein
MVLLNILTRVSRVTNIRQIYESISKDSKNFKIIWWTLFDVSAITEVPTDLLVFLDGKSKIKFFDSSKNDYLLWGGINEIIDEIEDGFVYVLDDDNILHENFYDRLSEIIDNNPDKSGFIFNQKVDGKDFTKLDVRLASPENTKVQSIDMAQFLLDRK